MSAASNVVPRKPAQRIGTVPVTPNTVGGFVPVTHEMLGGTGSTHLWWVGSTWTEQQIIERLLSLINQRDYWLECNGREKQGLTWPMMMSKLVKGIRCRERMAQYAVDDLLGNPDEYDDEDEADEERRLPAIRRISLKQALKDGKLTRADVKEAVQDGKITKLEAQRPSDSFLYEMAFENWPKLATMHFDEWNLEEPDDEDEDETDGTRIEVVASPSPAPEPEPEPAIVAVAPSSPLILLPGAGRRPMPVPDLVRRAFATGLPVETDYTGTAALAIHFEALGSVIRCSISDAPMGGLEEKRIKGERSPQCSAGSPAALIRNQLRQVLDPEEEPAEKRIWRKYLPDEPFSDAWLDRIAAELKGLCPPIAASGPSFAATLHHNLKKPPKVLSPPWFVWVAGQAFQNWKQHQSLPKARPAKQPEWVEDWIAGLKEGV